MCVKFILQYHQKDTHYDCVTYERTKRTTKKISNKERNKKSTEGGCTVCRSLHPINSHRVLPTEHRARNTSEEEPGGGGGGGGAGGGGGGGGSATDRSTRERCSREFVLSFLTLARPSSLNRGLMPAERTLSRMLASLRSLVRGPWGEDRWGTESVYLLLLFRVPIVYWNKVTQPIIPRSWLLCALPWLQQCKRILSRPHFSIQKYRALIGRRTLSLLPFILLPCLTTKRSWRQLLRVFEI